MTLKRGASPAHPGGALRAYTLNIDSRSKGESLMGDDAEDSQRLRTILRGAFAGPPTPLKDIPKRNGKKRTIGKDQPRRRRPPTQKPRRLKERAY
jgi:hypothetical protein